jgi:hypothetical protein
MTNFDTKISRVLLSFLHGPQKYQFHQTMCEHVEHENIHAYIFPKFFNILKSIFQIKGAYTYGIKNAFPFLMRSLRDVKQKILLPPTITYR